MMSTSHVGSELLEASNDGVKKIKTLASYLVKSKEISFTQLSDDRDNSYLAVQTRASKHEETKRVKLELLFKNEEPIELEQSTQMLLNEHLMPCLEMYGGKIENLKFTFFDDRMPSFINAVNAVFLKRGKPLKKLIFDCCGSQQGQDESSIFDPSILLQLCQLTAEFHVDYEDREPSNSHDLPLFLSVLRQVKTLKVVGFSCTFFDDVSTLVDFIVSNVSLKEIVLYNAFAKITKSELTPLVDALKGHQSLQKFTFLHTKLHSSIYKWAISTIIENQNVIGFCTDGFYAQNSTWLGRLIGNNDRVTEINLSHPQYEDDYERMASSGATLSLIQGISRNKVLTSVKLVGIPINGEAAKALRCMIENNETIVQLSCGNNFMMPECFSLIIGGLISNTVIKRLSIQSLDLDMAGAQTLSDVLTSNVSLASLSVSAHRRRYSLRRRNRTAVEVDPAQAAKLIADGLRQNTTLKCLSLPAILHDESCMAHFSKVLACDNTTLEHLKFWHNLPCEIKQVQYLTMLNRFGRRRLFQPNTPSGLWANALAAKNDIDWVRYVVTGRPILFDCHPPKSMVVDDIQTKKRARYE